MINREGNESPFPSLAGKELAVPAGEYRLISGSDEPIQFDPSRFDELADADYPTLAGQHFRGLYMLDNGTSCSVLSFLYHKLDAQGNLEETERAVIATGVGYGEYPSHEGQPRTWYIVGAQIGTVDPRFGDFDINAAPGLITPKNFSMACMVGNPFGEPLLANPNPAQQ